MHKLSDNNGKSNIKKDRIKKAKKFLKNILTKEQLSDILNSTTKQERTNKGKDKIPRRNLRIGGMVQREHKLR